jgi:hypothetical protein
LIASQVSPEDLSPIRWKTRHRNGCLAPRYARILAVANAKLFAFNRLVNPEGYSVASKCVRKENTERSPDEPDHSAEVQIVVSPVHFQWLTKQSEFLGVTKQELIADVLAEWICRNRTVSLPRLEASVMVRWALDEFMQRHREEFLPVDGES